MNRENVNTAMLLVGLIILLGGLIYGIMWAVKSTP
jgi:ABC-type transport system involved in cytochrome c biogenesis permease subunit